MLANLVERGLQHPLFKIAGLSCDPGQASFADWNALGTFGITHPAIVPAGQYDVQMIDSSCDQGDEQNFSAPLEVTKGTSES